MTDGDDADPLLRRIDAELGGAANEPGCGVLPAAVRWDPPRLHGPVHMVDGDGASLCQEVAAADLVRVGEGGWRAVARERRCGHCQLLLDLYGGGDL